MRARDRRLHPVLAGAGALLAAWLGAPIPAAAPASAPSAAPEPVPVPAAADPGILGFSRGTLEAQRRLEGLVLRLPDAARIEAHARALSARPHVAGTQENEEVARYIFERFKEAGLETEMKRYPVYLGYVKRARLEQVDPEPRALATPETPAGAPEDPWRTLNWNAYSPSCDLTREVVYVNYARPEDFAALEAMGVAVKDRVLLARYFHGYRGGKALEAERRGAAGIIFYSDPAEDGYVRGDAFPEGPWGSDGHIQRGAAVYDFLVPGDPLTPGWASLPGAKRIRPEEATILPRIPSIPISGRDGLVILEALRGPVVPRGWQGGLPVTYHVGPGPSRVHLAIESSFETRAITDVIGVLRGSDEPDTTIVLGNHHDAWVYGAVDPVSGTAAMLELARVAGDLARRGLRPRRTLVFGNWDAEEWTLTGSTEWGEEHERDLAAHGAACLNVDSAASGFAFQASAVPTLRRFISEVLRDVPDPKTGRDLLDATAAVARDEEGFKALYGGPPGAPSADRVRYDILGSGSDYTVFFNHLGIPSIDAGFEGPYGVYHSIDDSYDWMRRFGDPGFLYHAAMVRIWGLMAYRMANADALPFEESPYPADLVSYVADLEKEARAPLPDLADLKSSLAEWAGVAAEIDRSVAAALAGDAPPGKKPLAALNAALMKAERDLLGPAGLPKRPWFRHLVYAPLPTYAAETLPGLREAAAEQDGARARAQAALLASAIRRRAATIGAAARALAAAGPEPSPGSGPAPSARRRDTRVARRCGRSRR